MFHSHETGRAEWQQNIHLYQFSTSRGTLISVPLSAEEDNGIIKVIRSVNKAISGPMYPERAINSSGEDAESGSSVR
ncbi:hypothetical protein TNCT_640931 [Trichonephila clavata]|uniref:Uncharacterized protein n=1 Tax=Trichonephila clavata TaxID=2740835 RepID=A0A8X6LA21_TRICU|nr:hypothetical protein TNCT_640931 [Trichonephila clavata]